MNTRALLEDTLRVILAAIGIALIAYGIYRFADVTANQDRESAKNLLDNFLAKVEALEDGQTATLTFQGFESDSIWYLVAWNKTSADAPEQCFFTSCLCICKDGADLDHCNNRNSFCREIAYDALVETAPFEFSDSFIGGTGGVGTLTGVAHNACIVVPDALFELSFNKTQSLLSILTNGHLSYKEYDSCRKLAFNRIG